MSRLKGTFIENKTNEFKVKKVQAEADVRQLVQNMQVGSKQPETGFHQNFKLNLYSR